MNRTFNSDDWTSWFDEAEGWAGHAITDGETVDRLYARYLADEAPLYAVMAVKGALAAPAVARPVTAARAVFPTHYWDANGGHVVAAPAAPPIWTLLLEGGAILAVLGVMLWALDKLS